MPTSGHWPSSNSICHRKKKLGAGLVHVGRETKCSRQVWQAKWKGLDAGWSLISTGAAAERDAERGDERGPPVLTVCIWILLFFESCLRARGRQWRWRLGRRRRRQEEGQDGAQRREAAGREEQHTSDQSKQRKTATGITWCNN